MRIWWDELSREVRVLEDGYPNGKVTHDDRFIVKLNGHIMRLVLYADEERGEIIFHDLVIDEPVTKRGNVRVITGHALKGLGGEFTHMGPPVNVVTTQRGTKYR